MYFFAGSYLIQNLDDCVWSMSHHLECGCCNPTYPKKRNSGISQSTLTLFLWAYLGVRAGGEQPSCLIEAINLSYWNLRSDRYFNS